MNLLPQSLRLERRLKRFFKRNHKLKLTTAQKLNLVHFSLSALLEKYSISEVIDHFKSKERIEQLVYDLQFKGWMYYQGESEPEFLPCNLNPDIFKHESLFRKLTKEIGLPHYEIHGSLLVPEF